MSTVGWWQIGREAWNTTLALDEFGPGTLDGDPAHGGSNDACGPAAIVNGACGYEGRPLTYTEIGLVRADMINHGQWTQPAVLSNPRTGGATMADVAWELPQRGYTVAQFLDEQSATLSAQQLHDAIAHRSYVIVMVFNATALPFNEQGPHRHFVGIAAYSGDAGSYRGAMSDEHGYGKIYVLNSDVAGQHGTATGQWMWLDDLIHADPRAFAVMAPKPVASQPDIAGAVVDINTIQQIVDRAVADALSKLQPTTSTKTTAG